MAVDKEMLEAMRAMMQEELEPIKADISTIKEDMDEIKENVRINRHTGNLLLKWAEKADRTVVNVGLYDDK